MRTFKEDKLKLNQLHAVSRTQQGKQREPSLKTLSSPHIPRIFRRILEALRIEWRNSTSRFASTPERGNGNIHLNKYSISSSGCRTQFVPCAKSGHVLKSTYIKISSESMMKASNGFSYLISLILGLHLLYDEFILSLHCFMQ